VAFLIVEASKRCHGSPPNVNWPNVQEPKIFKKHHIVLPLKGHGRLCTVDLLIKVT